MLIVATRLSAADVPAPTPAPPPATAATGEEDDESPSSAKPDPAATKFWQAITLLGHKSASDQANGRNLLQAAADLEYTHAQTLLADCYLSGSYGFSKDPRKAANLLRLAAERGNAFAMVSLGSCYVTGTGVRKDQDKAVTWLTAALAPGANYSRPTPPADYAAPENEATVAGKIEVDPIDSAKATAHFLLGQILAQQKKFAEAQEHFVAAATAGVDGRAGIYPAAVAAALNYALGQGVPRDQAKASEMLDRSRKLTARLGITMVRNYVALKMVDEFAVADLEESIAEAGTGYQSALQLQIATVFADKKSKDYNPKEAVKWYELAAENDQVWAMLSLALLYASNELGAPDPVKAFEWLEKASQRKTKHYLAEANRAICYQHGLGTAPDTAKAAEIFSKYRDYEISCYLGSIGQSPKKLMSYEDDLALNQQWAKKDPHAQYLMGLRHRYGWGVKADFDDTERWFKKAAKANHGGAYSQLGQVHQQFAAAMPVTLVGLQLRSEYTKSSVEYFRKGAELGDASAMAGYAAALQSGATGQPDVAKAEALYLKCLAKDPSQSVAHNNLATIYEAKLHELVRSVDAAATAATRAKMLEHYEAASQQEYGLAAANLGRIYHDGLVVPQDYRKAYGYFEEAGAHGYPSAHYQLGLMHENGQGVPVTYSEAAYHYRLAALDGNIEALRRLVNFYLTGQGVSLDLDRAAFWLQRMAQLGQTGALMTLTDILMRKGDYTNAVPLLKNLAALENHTVAGFACERLGQCYQRGLGVKASPSKAQKYFAKAEEYGDPGALTRVALEQIAAKKITEGLANLNRAATKSGPASFYLGQMYFFGTNVGQDRTKGIEFLRKSAGLNHPDALYFLAVMTYNHEVGAPSLDEAIRFAEQAETFGLSKATDIRERLERRRKNPGTPTEEKTKSRSS